MLLATTACTLSKSKLPELLRTCCVLTHVTYKCASRHNGVCTFSTLNGNRIIKKWSEPLVLCPCSLPHVLRTATACTFSTCQLPKVVRDRCVLSILLPNCASSHNGVHFLTSQLPKVVRSWYILTSKCASRRNAVQFFNIATSKSRPKLKCFVHFDFQMCFAQQRRALFQHLHFQKPSEPHSF